MINKILKWKCPVCDKEITSLYEEQFEYNKKAHSLTHKEGGNKNENLRKENTMAEDANPA